MTTLAVDVAGLTKRFGQVTALDDVDLAVDHGELHGLLGVNGAGKTTLLRVLFGLVQPDDGSALVLGRDTRELRAPDPAVAGFVDRPRFYPYLSARRNLRVLADLDRTGLPAAGIDDALERVGLGHAGGRKVSGWSTGMLQRLGVAAALLRSPRLLVLDEPTEGLDPAGARDLRGLLRDLNEDGVTVLLSSHDMSEVDELCSSVTIVHRGRVAASSSVEELRRNAPPAVQHLRTSDDRRAADVLRELGAEGVEPHPRGGVLLRVGPAQLDTFVIALGKSDIAVRRIDQDVDALTALFFSLTDDERAAA